MIYIHKGKRTWMVHYHRKLCCQNSYMNWGFMHTPHHTIIIEISLRRKKLTLSPLALFFSLSYSHPSSTKIFPLTWFPWTTREKAITPSKMHISNHPFNFIKRESHNTNELSDFIKCELHNTNKFLDDLLLNSIFLILI